MLIAFVMPCLNEEGLIEAAAGSIGFGRTQEWADEGVFLVVVDNGSTDGTLAAMDRIAAHSRPGSVLLTTEPERGYVPPRRRGVLRAAQLAEEKGFDPRRLLILQADADTVYTPGYARWMWKFLGDREGALLEGAVKRDAAFDQAYPSYRALELQVDGSIGDSGVADEDEVIVDDKACGYLLSDYQRWGGHFREYDRLGSEIYAETTRLLLRAKLAHGATKVRVNPAQAIPSRRRILEDPLLQFATAGFPRESSWIARWRARHPIARPLSELSFSEDHPEWVDACFYRRAHEIALFWLLPWLVRRSVGSFHPDDVPEMVRPLLELVPLFSATDLATSPSLALISALDLIEQYPHAFR